jgi:hypothetical protein
MSLEKLNEIKKVALSKPLYDEILLKIHSKKNEMAEPKWVLSALVSLLLLILVNCLVIVFLLNTEIQGDFISVTQFSIYHD